MTKNGDNHHMKTNIYLKCLYQNHFKKDYNENALKINATINNSKIFKEIQKEYKTFSDYIWHFTENKIVYETDKTSSELSDAISKDLKKRGMKFVGTTIIYSYLQAIGVIYSHEEGCFLKK